MDDTRTVEIAQAVAEAEGVSATDLEYRLEEYVPMEQVEKLDERANTTWTLSFRLPDHHVTVTSDGGVFVDAGKEATPT